MALPSYLFLRLLRFARKEWFPWVISALGFCDMFLLVVPNDLLVISEAAISPERRRSSVLIVAVGSALGALCLALAIREGFTLLAHEQPGDAGAHWLGPTKDLLHTYGSWALFLAAASPIPVQPFVAAALVSGITPSTQFLFVLGGRLVKYSVLALLPTLLPERFKPGFFPESRPEHLPR